jgi:hypothetical protein
MTMRPLILIPLLALAACSGENQGWNPNYQAFATPYGNYLRDRELALTGYRPEPPRVIPVALPARAPTAQEIAGPSPVQILERAVTPASTQPRRVRLRGAPAIDPVPPSLDPVSRIQRQPVVAVPVARQATVIRPAPPAAPVQVTARTLPSGAQPLYPRTAQANGNCGAFESPAAAQRAFIAEGGPQLDPLGLDPDGNGYACSFRPAPAR